MLTPEELRVIPYSIIELYQNLEDDIISDIARRLEKVGHITDTPDWQIYMLGNMGNDLKNIKKRIAETNKLSKEEINNIFLNSVDKSMEFENVRYKEAGKRTISLYNNPTMLQFVKANARKTHNELENLTKSLGFKDTLKPKSIQKFYQDTLNYAHFQVASGAFSSQQAVNIAVKKLADSGLKTIDYVSGVSTHIDVAVRRATLTGIQQTVSEISLMQMDELGGEYVEVTAHMGARPSHADWQGKVYHVGGEKNGYPDFEGSTGYGTGDGLCGWNCRHGFSVFFPEISKRNYTDKQIENIDPAPIEYKGKKYTYYECTQKQRQIERDIRKTKRSMIAYEIAGAKEDFTFTSVKLRMQKDEYLRFCNKAGIRPKLDRTQAYKFNKSISQKGVWSYKKELSSIADGMLEKYTNIEPDITLLLQKISNKTRGILEGLDFKFKDKDSLIRKIVSDSKEKGISIYIAGKDIKDVLRYTIVHDENTFTQNYFKTVELLQKKGYHNVKVKNTFRDNSSYKGINTFVKDKHNNIFELQYHTPKSLEVKEKYLHDLYEEYRNLDPKENIAKEIRKEMIKISDTVMNPKDVSSIG